MTQAEGTIGLALAGGVLEGGFYEIGVLCALQDAVEGLDFTRLDVYVGVSSGAVITSLLANGLSPRTLSRAILSRADPEINLDPNILFTPAVREYARRALKVPGLVARWVRGRIEGPLERSGGGVGARWARSRGGAGPGGGGVAAGTGRAHPGGAVRQRADGALPGARV